MREVKGVIPMGIKCLILSLAILLFACGAQATIVDSGSVNLSGGYMVDILMMTWGSYSVDLDYWVYDGSTGDPLGATGDLQIAFQLTHNGAVAQSDISLNVGRFNVFGPEITAPQPFYASAQAVGVGLAPSFIGIYPPGDAENKASFLFEDWLAQPNLGDGDVSQLLVLELTNTPGASFPLNILLELDNPTHDDAFIEIIPEPATVSLLAAGFGLLSFKRKRK